MTEILECDARDCKVQAHGNMSNRPSGWALVNVNRTKAGETEVLLCPGCLQKVSDAIGHADDPNYRQAQAIRANARKENR